ncbi:MAG: DUF3552 domain-containing protein, partial [Lachnospiraceae bacterium]|nr:DUF3552 domain-containing protein [Lachnospiraceae bacterium]
MTTMEIVFLAIAVVAVLAASLIVAVNTKRIREQNAKIGNADAKAREIIDEALREAESKKRESLLEIKEESIRTKNDLDREIKERRAEIQRNERRIQQKEENIDRKTEAIERKEQSLTAKEESLAKEKEKIAKLNEERIQELERISGLTSEQAKEHLLKIVEDDVKIESAKLIKDMEQKVK